MRWLTLVLFAACGGGAQRPAPGPTLEADPPRTMPAMPVRFETEFAVPTSAPRGEPIKIAAFTPAVGMRRTRTVDKRFDVDQDLGDGNIFEQRTTTRFVLREEVLAAADTTIQKLQVEADVATEHLELRGTPHDQTLLEGSYLVRPGADPRRGLTVTRPAGMDVGTREQEELSYLYADEVGVPYAITVLLATKPLRFGESVKLTTDELKQVGAETDVTLSLIALDGSIATFQFTATASTPYALGDKDDIENIGTKATVAIEITTGRMVRADLLDLRVVEKKSVRRSQRAMKLEYTR